MSIFKIIVHHSETFSNIVIPPIFSKSFEQKLLAALAFLPKSRNNEEKLLSYFFCHKFDALQQFIQCLFILYQGFSSFNMQKIQLESLLKCSPLGPWAPPHPF